MGAWFGSLACKLPKPGSARILRGFRVGALTGGGSAISQTPAYTRQSFCLGERPADDAVEVEVGGEKSI